MRLYIFMSFVLGSLAACAPSSFTGKSNPSEVTTDESFDGIIGGEDVIEPEGLARHVVMIHSQLHDESNYICTGALISPIHVLTAAHCLKANSKKVRVIFEQAPYSRPLEPSVIRDVVAQKFFPEYNQDTRTGPDLAVLKISSPAPRPYEAALIPSQYFTALSAQFEISSYGYGLNTDKKRTNDNDKRGSGTLRTVKLKAENYHSEQDVFWVDQRFGKGLCNGDSGGPSFYRRGYETFLIGVHSQVKYDVGSLTVCSHKGIITNVAHYSDWIKKAMLSLPE